MTLEVLISTIGEDGIGRVAAMNLPRIAGISYLVGWQMPGYPPDLTLPDALRRDDVAVIQTDGTGLSRNRNVLIKAMRADIGLIADDDVEFTEHRLRAIVRTMEENRHIDVATFMMEGTGKVYPPESCDLTVMPKGYWVSSCEIAFRATAVKGKVWFDERFGLGSGMFEACEDGVFLLECRRKGLNCKFFPTVTVAHRCDSTGMRLLTPGVIMAEGAYIRLAHGACGALRLPLFSWRAVKAGRGDFFTTVYYLIKGFFSVGKRKTN